jgi:hypothetical protein
MCRSRISGHHLAVQRQWESKIASCVLALFVVACSADSGGAPPPSPAPSRSAGALPAVVANCENPQAAPQHKPVRIVAACGGDAVFILSDIRYSSWNPQLASGSAHVRYNSCQPNCAAGHLVTATAKFRLTGARKVRGRVIFTSVLVHSHSGPDGRYPLGGSV